MSESTAIINRPHERMIYSIWLNRILDAHVRKAWNHSNSLAEEKEEDELIDQWDELDESLRIRLYGLSADLETLHDNDRPHNADDLDETSVEDIDSARQAAYEGEDWDRFLELLRLPPRNLGQAEIDYLRGLAWTKLGHHEVALWFFKNSTRLDPNATDTVAKYLECLSHLNEQTEFLSVASRLEKSGSPRIHFLVGEWYQKLAGKERDLSYAKLALDAYTRSMKEIERGGYLEEGYIFSRAIVSKALFEQVLGQPDRARETIDLGKVKFPKNRWLIAADGFCRWERKENPTEQLRMFIRNGFQSAWPVDLLLTTSTADQIDESLEQDVTTALETANDSRFRASLLIVLAIHTSDRKNDRELGLRYLREAYRIAPYDSRIRQMRLTVEAKKYASFFDAYRSTKSHLDKWTFIVDLSRELVDDEI